MNSQTNKTINDVHTNFFAKAFSAFSKELEPLTHFNWSVLNYSDWKSDSSNKFLMDLVKLILSGSILFKKFCNRVKHLDDALLASANIERNGLRGIERDEQRE